MGLKQGFDHFLNLHMRSTAEHLARYVDKKMRFGDRKGGHVNAVVTRETEEGVGSGEEVLEEVMRVFKHLQEKDIFEAFYKKHLAKRLLTGKQAPLVAATAWTAWRVA